MKYLDIVVFLGKKCNLNCIYCVQHKDSITNIDYGDNTDYVIDFINSICNNHDFYISVGFYGGEPLLYFQKMKKITEKTTANEYRVISNGKELNNQIVNFFNKLTKEFDEKPKIFSLIPVAERTKIIYN